ncbi:hypothetical protein FZEAL_8013 [Fusarium zealandicum]|uniref:Uncharacterized protein n=1 Tax=Fusarium zealandicum TaxID=1053134 RepID=A0A8H4UEL8_9HYPO|nr:hypothetical protein FZEAL_8013 [Fusarium zealandicum]
MHFITFTIVAIAGLASAVVTPPVPASNNDGVCPENTGFFQVCSNGFRGCCKSDACAGSWCPDFKAGTYEPVKTWKVRARQSDPTVCAPGTGFFQSCSNGFRGCCTADACTDAWCPDFETGTFEPVKTEKVSARQSDPTVCAPGTGFFQSCSNGFRGCCKGDACASSWCPDYKTGTFKPVKPVNTGKVSARQSDPTVCAPGTGFFQSCSNGFRGCCEADVCTQSSPVCPSQ